MQQGFTLVELLITIAIVGIVASMALPQIADTVATQELNIFANNLAADIRAIQQMAINTNGVQTIYTIYFFNGSTPQYNLHDGKRSFKIVYLPASVEMTGDPQLIRYAITGSPSSGSQTIEFRSKRTGKYRYVIVASITGRVRVSNTGGSE
jgi:prepilin-type N-terminal cleavage/methylation domain-containing protein